MLVLLSVGEVDLVALFGLLDDIEVNLDASTLNFLAIHFHKSSLGCLVSVKLYVSKTFRLLGHPVVG
jgi:hypothetical protein